MSRPPCCQVFNTAHPHILVTGLDDSPIDESPLTIATSCSCGQALTKHTYTTPDDRGIRAFANGDADIAVFERHVLIAHSPERWN